MDGRSIYEALGLEGGIEQEIAEPAAEEETPVEEQVEEHQEENPEKTEQPPEQPAEPAEQSAEERSRQAHGRRQRELQAAVDAARAEERGKVDSLLKSLGIRNPQTDEVVDTLDALEAYERDLVTRRFEAGKATEADIRRIVKEETAPKPEPMSKEEIQTLVDRQITEIGQLDPTIKSLDDILKSDVGEAFRSQVAANPGQNFVEAYKAVAGKRIEAARRKAAEQAARNRIESKDHLSGTTTRGQGSKPVPRAELEIFRSLMPGVSDAEFERYYNKR